MNYEKVIFECKEKGKTMQPLSKAANEIFFF